MGEPGSPLAGLVRLSRFDASIARMAAERKKLEDQLADKLLELKSLRQTTEQKAAELSDRKLKYQREEKRLKEEEQKLVDRRKALNSFSNYKLQQAAEKEIEQSSKQLSMQETTLLQGLEGIDEFEKEVTALKEQLEAFEKECAEFEEEAKGTIAGLEERSSDTTEERDKVLPVVNKVFLTQYNRVKNRYPVDPVVPVENNKVCAGCFMQIPPQMMVQVAKGSDIVNCRGCGRILYLSEEGSEESGE